MKFIGKLILAAAAFCSVPSLAATYTIDNNHTSLSFDIGHLGIASVFGRFNTIAGGFDLADDGQLSNINITIDANTVDTKIQRRDDHLRTADFFNVAAFPSITFVSNTVTKEKGNTYNVSGTVTMMGVARTLNAVVTHNGTYTDPASGAVKQGATVRFSLKRSDFGMTGYQAMIADDVNIVFSTEAFKN